MRTRMSRRVLFRPPWPRLRRAGAGVWAAMLVALNCPVEPALAADSASPSALPGKAITVQLEYQETRYVLLYRDVPVETAAGRFAKEPPMAADRALRGVLRFGNSPSNALAFIWQSERSQLFLDLNHNRDLTDDPAGVCSGRKAFAAPGAYHQVFTNLHLAFPASSAGAPMLVNLDCFYDDRSQRMAVNATLHSWWQGKVSWGGQEWQVGLVPNLADQPGSFHQGQILLRPWAEHEQSFYARCEPLDTRLIGGYWRDVVMRAPDTLPVGARVFFAGQACRLDWAAEPQGSGEKFALQLTEQPTALGELKISGSLIRRLVLEGGPFVVVLDHPEASVRVPVGRYFPRCVRLQQGRAEAYFRFGLPASGNENTLDEFIGGQLPVVNLPPAEQGVVVAEEKPGVMEVGGPLTNCVAATHRGGELFLSYRLLGAGNGEYRMLGQGYDADPQFTVRAGTHRVGGGKFEYG